MGGCGGFLVLRLFFFRSWEGVGRLVMFLFGLGSVFRLVNLVDLGLSYFGGWVWYCSFVL